MRSEKEKKRERWRRLQKKHSPPDQFKQNRKYKRRESRSFRLLRASLRFFAASLAVLLVPLGLFHFGYKRISFEARRKKRTKNASRAKGNTSSAFRAKENKEALTRKSEVTNIEVETVKPIFNAENTGTSNEDGAELSNYEDREAKSLMDADAHRSSPEPIEDISGSEATRAPCGDICEAKSHSEPVKNDESTPVSSPICERDQYIRKRMSFSLAVTAAEKLLAELEVGAYLDLAADRDGNGSVSIVYSVERIGYVKDEDSAPISVCLKLGRKIYGVVIDKRIKSDAVTYEYEAWFRA